MTLLHAHKYLFFFNKYFISFSVNTNINKMDAYFALMKSAQWIIYIYLHDKRVRQMDFQMLMLEESSVIPPSWKALFMSIWLTGEVAEGREVCTREHADRWQICRFLSFLRVKEAGLELQARY